MDDIQFFDFSVNLLRAILWQYNEAKNLQALLQLEQAWYDANQKEFWENWVRDVFDLRTCNDFGLNVWAIILGQSIYTNIAASGEIGWGFGPDDENFDNGNFVSDSGHTQQLPIEISRLLLRLRYFQLVSSGTVPETNRMLKYLFSNAGKAYLVDNYDMTQAYVFDFPLPTYVSYIFNNFDILPRPAGVKTTVSNGTSMYFGFGPDNANFDNGSFRS